jgi:hypothetical protein
MNNLPIHMAKVTRAELSKISIHLTHHPHYSPDLAPSDFFIFGYLKMKMLGFESDSPEAQIDQTKAKFQRTPSEILDGVFKGWIIRVQKCIEHEGDCFPEDKKVQRQFLLKLLGAAYANRLLDTLAQQPPTVRERLKSRWSIIGSTMERKIDETIFESEHNQWW